MDLDEFKKRHAGVLVEEVNDVDYIEDENGDGFEIETTNYIIKKLPPFDDLALRVDPSQLKRLDQIVQSKPEIFKEVLGIRFDKTVEVVLNRVVAPSLFAPMPMLASGEPIKVSTFYRGKAVSAHIYARSMIDLDIGFLSSHIVGNLINHRTFIATITGIQKQ